MLKKYILPVLFASFFFISCIDKIKEPVMPSWDLELNFPLANKSFTLEDIVKKQKQIEIDESTPNRILKFSSDKIQQDTTIDYLFNNTFDMEADTSFPVIGASVTVQMIARKDSVRIDSAVIKSGIIEYTMKNNNPTSVSVEFLFPGFTRQNGSAVDTLRIGANVPANSQVNISVPMESYRYSQPPNQPFGSTRPGIWIKAYISSSIIGIGQNLEVNLKVKDLKIEFFKGQVKPFYLGKRTQIVENALSGDLKDFISSVSFDSVSLKLETFTSFEGFDVALRKFQVIGTYRNGGSPIYLRFNGQNLLDTLIPAGTTSVLILTNSNTNINEFLNLTPDSIKILGELVINPYYKVGKITTNDRISFSFLIDAYSKMKITNATLNDTLELDISDDTRDKIANANEATLNLTFTNGLPLETEITGYFLDRNKNKLFYFTRQTGNGLPSDTVFRISGALVNDQGIVTSKKQSIITMNLNQEDFEKFKNAYFIVQRFRISSTDQKSVMLRAKDDVSVKIFGRINYKIER